MVLLQSSVRRCMIVRHLHHRQYHDNGTLISCRLWIGELRRKLRISSMVSISTTTTTIGQHRRQQSLFSETVTDLNTHPRFFRYQQLNFNTNNKISVRNQATDATTTTDTNANGNKRPAVVVTDEEEERLLENIEEIVDVPVSALNEVIDRSKYTDKVPIPMPDLESTSSGKEQSYVKEWFFAKGDIIQHEDVLCDIVTPDFTYGMETDDEGITIMGDIVVPAGQPVPNGTVLCYTMHESNGDNKNSNDDDDDDATISKLANDDDDDDDDHEKDVEKKRDSDENKP